VTTIADRWKRVCERVEASAIKAGRNPNDITTVGVSKYVDASSTRELFEAGCIDLGESRPQVLWEKAELLKDLTIRWHLIGHLQRNKSKRTVRLLSCIHSIDSIRIAQQISEDASGLENPISVLLEVNVSGDSTKTGLSPDELPTVAESVIELPGLRVEGLMGMSGLGKRSPREDFVKLREIRDALQIQFGSRVELKHLSMGMSGDFEEAVAEGATILRIGSILFED
jgi:pyridoxal phosphate enzyme (YggS family)